MDTLTNIYNYANLTHIDVKIVHVNAYSYAKKFTSSNLHYGQDQILRTIHMRKKLHTSFRTIKYMLSKMQPYVNLANVNKTLQVIFEHW